MRTEVKGSEARQPIFLALINSCFFPLVPFLALGCVWGADSAIQDLCQMNTVLHG